eukprot:TRINITY_DN6667_c0_g2_i1.p1 TRINITY_DN6667_c0_g2~~TRINITY_DN6667_c0_g2_i1.p1  ORF type:complete len:585 (+),score=105.90 TRINITY_DN6667_c0_g2_i1:226-1980(+)
MLLHSGSGSTLGIQTSMELTSSVEGPISKGFNSNPLLGSSIEPLQGDLFKPDGSIQKESMKKSLRKSLNNKKLDKKNESRDDIGMGENLIIYEGVRAEIAASEIQMTKVIGKGSYGTVYEGVCRGHIVAVKRLHRQDLSEDSLRLFRQEVGIMSKLFHPNIVLYMGACSEPGNLMIVTEKMDGDLEQLLNNKNIHLSLCKRMQMAKQCALGINWLHCSKPVFLHRDIKPSNLLVTKNFDVKISDFNLSAVKKEDDSDRGVKGTPLYMAPEIYLGEPYTEKSDIYSFGIVLWQLFTRNTPYNNSMAHFSIDTLLDAVCDGSRPEIPADCPQTLSNLIQDCWSEDPTSRPDFRDIIWELDSVIIESAIQEVTGQEFWDNYLIGKISVSWSIFQKMLAEWFGIDEEEITGETPTIHQLNFRCFQALIVDNQDNVNIEKFGRVLDCFGPLDCDLLDYIRKVTRQSWFHGEISTKAAEDLLRYQAEGAYLVRLSTTSQGCFTISAMRNRIIQHQRVLYDPNERKVKIGTRSYNDLAQLVTGERITLGLQYPCSGSKFTIIWNDFQKNEYLENGEDGVGERRLGTGGFYE